MNLGLHYKNQDHIFDEKEVNGVPFLSYPMLEETGIVNHGFSTRLGGVSKGCWATMNISTTRGDDPEDVRENQRRIAGAIGVQPEDLGTKQAQLMGTCTPLPLACLGLE